MTPSHDNTTNPTPFLQGVTQVAIHNVVVGNNAPANNGNLEADRALFKILVVDDEHVTRLRLEHLLKNAGYSVLTAANGREAIDIVRTETIDLVLTDFVMPVLDGVKTVRLIRQLYDRAQLPVIMMTVTEGREQILQTFDVGANDYIAKPVDNEILLARLNSQLLIRKTQKALRESEERYALASRGTNDGIWDWNLKTGKVYLSPRWLEMTGLQNENLQSQNWMDLIHCEDRSRVTALLESHLCGQSESFETELRMQSSDGSYRWMLCRGLAIQDDTGVPCRIAGSLTDITVGKVADPLTGLPNRVLFQDRVTRAVESLGRMPSQRFGIIYMDVDNFKLINDHLGHQVGDDFLIAVASRIEKAIRKADSFVARLGGDEFAVVVEGIDSTEDVIRVANRIHKELIVPFRVGNREILTRASMGIAVAAFSQEGQNVSVDSLLSQADIAMYNAKKQTDQAYCVFESHMLEESTMALELGHELKLAIKRQEFKVFYQPIIEVASGRTTGFEALLRWHRPNHGFIGPGTFIPIAESNGLIIEIGDWILAEACHQIQQWNQEYDCQLIVSVNVSIRQIAKGRFQSVVKRVLNETGLSPELLRIEVTETVLMQNTEETIEVLNELQETGIKIAIDDFGTGFSSLSYLHKMPIDVLKIDRSFIMRMAESEKHMAIVRTITTLAKSLNLDIVAEGIETREQLASLSTLGCQKAQGYLFSKPKPDAEAAKLIRRVWPQP